MGLERVTRLMAELDRPQNSLRGALVAGTNGKGSVVAMTRSVLAEAGLTVGTMPKPHLVSYRERVAVDGEPISPDDFAAAVSRVLPAVDHLAPELGPPTEFEVLTAAAITELARREVQLVLVEVGLGGRLDATNVLDLGVAAITNVQKDHEAILGSTLRAIGGEKAAIIKPSNLAATGASGRGLTPILQRCQEVGASLRRAGAGQAYHSQLRHQDWDGIVVDVTTPAGVLADLHIGLLGGHQAQNGAVALALLDAIGEDGARRGLPVPMSEAVVRRGLSAARWPGRLEMLDGGRLGLGRVLLDGAHNPAGAAALTSSLRALGLRRPTVVFGVMRGKNVPDILRAMAPLRPRFVFTRVDDPGAHDPAALARAWRRITGNTAATAPTPLDALRRSTGDPIVVAGSLYLVGAVRGLLTGTAEAS